MPTGTGMQSIKWYNIELYL